MVQTEDLRGQHDLISLAELMTIYGETVQYLSGAAVIGIYQILDREQGSYAPLALGEFVSESSAGDPKVDHLALALAKKARSIRDALGKTTGIPKETQSKDIIAVAAVSGTSEKGDLALVAQYGIATILRFCIEPTDLPEYAQWLADHPVSKVAFNA